MFPELRSGPIMLNVEAGSWLEESGDGVSSINHSIKGLFTIQDLNSVLKLCFYTPQSKKLKI